MFASVAPRLAMLVAQHGAAIAAGVLTGAVVSGAGIATGAIHTGGGQAGPTTALLACPGAGPQVARISSGERLLVTARSADGRWLRVYVGEPGIDSGWAPTDVLHMQSAVDGLPIADCSVPSTLGPPPTLSPTLSPSASPTSGPTPTVGPTAPPTARPSGTPKPTRTPKPTPVPTSYKDPNPPIISGISVEQNCEEGSFGVSPMLEIYATDADDADSALTVRLFVDPPGPLPEYEYTGVYAPYLSLPGNWEAQWQQSSSWPSGVVKWRVTVTDPSGNTASRSSSSNSSDPSWIWNESTGTCPTP
jgi:hypothetical protein